SKDGRSWKKASEAGHDKRDNERAARRRQRKIPSVQAAREAPLAARREGPQRKRLEPGGVQVHAKRHQAHGHGKTDTGQDRHRLERLVGSDRRNRFHSTPPLFAQTGIGRSLLGQNSLWPIARYR